MDPIEHIKQMVEQKLSHEQFLVDLFVTAKKGPRKLMVIVDGDNGFGIDDCAELSRQLSKELDESGLVGDNYLLEVTSPGVDHPLKLKRQFKKNIGRSLRVKTADQTMEGKLIEVSDELIVLTQEVGAGKKKEIKTINLTFQEIEKAFVLVSFK
jgi:ribosome maturation factor RimP